MLLLRDAFMQCDTAKCERNKNTTNCNHTVRVLIILKIFSTLIRISLTRVYKITLIRKKCDKKLKLEFKSKI